MIDTFSQVFAKELENIVSKSLKKRPLTTILTTISLSISIAAIIFTLEKFENQRKQLEVKNITLTDRVQRLDNVQKSLIELNDFIQNQKNEIVVENQILENLKKEKSELEPIINANKELIDKIFLEQDKRNKWELWLSIGLGFVFGIIASFISSILYNSYRKYKQGKASA